MGCMCSTPKEIPDDDENINNKRKIDTSEEGLKKKSKTNRFRTVIYNKPQEFKIGT